MREKSSRDLALESVLDAVSDICGLPDGSDVQRSSIKRLREAYALFVRSPGKYEDRSICARSPKTIAHLSVELAKLNKDARPRIAMFFGPGSPSGVTYEIDHIRNFDGTIWVCGEAPRHVLRPHASYFDDDDDNGGET